MGNEPGRPMWPQVVILTITTFAVKAMCPGRCRCDDETLSAYCTSASLEVVPIQLNPEVHHMDLSDNKINNLYYTLTFYDNLHTLDLSTNNINSLGSDNFQSQQVLQFLNLSYNKIENLSKSCFGGLNSLTVLDLSYNRLETVYNYSFLQLPSLERLILIGNKITHLEGGLFKATKQLKEINLSNNQLLEIPTFSLKDALSLKYLSLSQNLIYAIEDGELPKLPKLVNLSLNGNVITKINGSAFATLTSLDRLDLSDNNLTYVPTSSLAKLSNLTRLKLSGNFIKCIPAVAFQGLFQLKYLHLDRLDLLYDLDVRSFVDNINLEKIYLNDNIGLKHLPTRIFHGNVRLLHVAIKNNGLATIDVTHFPLDHLRLLQVGGNPLECNCSLLWLWDLTHKQAKANIIAPNYLTEFPSELHLDIDDIRCVGPDNVANTLLVDVTQSQINCSFSWIITGWIIFIICLVCVFLFGVGFVLYGSLKRNRQRKSHLHSRAIPDVQIDVSHHHRTEKMFAYNAPPIPYRNYRPKRP